MPFDSQQYARSVREDTAELASYALSDRVPARSTSPRQRPAQTQLESHFLEPEGESASNKALDELHRDTIAEVSEPVSPAGETVSDKSPGTSVLTNMLRRSPPSTSPADKVDVADGDSDSTANDGDVGESNQEQSRLIITPNGVRMEVSERTPLLGKDLAFSTHHPDWIRGQQDLEGQHVKRRTSWPKLRNVMLWPRERGMDITRMVLNPKSWDRQAIWHNAVSNPVGFLPAVTLGLLLNILDALSYGMSNTF